MKKRIFARVGALLTLVFMVGSLFAACGSSNGTNTQETNSTTAVESSAQAGDTTQTDGNAIDTSKKVEIIMYLAGDAAADSTLVNQKLSQTMEKDLNCTLKIVNIPWSDWDQKYPLVLTSGENYDLIYTSGWAQFTNYANKGCFLELDDLLSKYAPDVAQQLSKDELDSGRGKDGKLYGIPAKVTSYSNVETYAIRGDLREKYGVAPITDLSSMEVYLDAVKSNEPGIIPFNLAGSGEAQLFMSSTDLEFVPGSSFVYTSGNNLRNAELLYLTPEFESQVNTMQRWNEKGYFSKSVLTNKIYSYTAFVDGKSAVAVGNPTQIKQAVESVLAQHPDWKPEAGSFRIKTQTGIHPINGMSGDGMAVGKNSENSERALMVLNKLRSDRDCYDTLFYGIKGKNYDLTSDGMVKLPDGVTSDKNGYPWVNEGQWGFAVQDFDRKSPTEWMDFYNVLQKSFQEVATPDLLANFAVDATPLSNEVAAMSEVASQYATPLRWGMTSNASKDLDNLRSKLKSAGSDKFMDEVKKQLNTYLDSINYSK